jgi:hypothetical protein
MSGKGIASLVFGMRAEKECLPGFHTRSPAL